MCIVGNNMRIFSKQIGIDLGTANTLVYIPGKGVVINEPTVVAISEYDNSVLAIGNEAKEMIGKTHDSIIAYNPIRDGVIADYRITEALVSYFINKAMGKWNIVKPEVMISVPAGVSSTERRAVIEVAVRAGAKAAHVVREPIVAAIGAGIPIYESQGYMVVDIGGGTIDVAVIALGGIVACNSVKTAGNKIDAAITSYLKKKHNLAIGDHTAEKIKIKIGAAVPLAENLEIMVKGRDYVSGLPKSVALSTLDVVEAISNELEEMMNAIKKVLHDTPPELAADIIDNGIIMTGGSSQLRGLTDLVHRQTGVRARLADDPLQCVIRGIGEALQHTDLYKRALLSKR